MTSLRPLRDADLGQIRGWPPYPGDMAQMDYALRERGWLEEFGSKADATVYVTEDSGELIAFTILAETSGREAEFRIALRADRTGLGLGGRITVDTLRRGFGAHGFSCIHLIVRKNNHRGIALYRRIGFAERGECRKDIHGVPVEFIRMEIGREEFVRMHGMGDVGESAEREEQ